MGLDGSTFTMRVFPIEPRQEKRLLLSYTQKLPVLYGEQTYRFPGGHNLNKVAQWELHVRVKNGVQLLVWSCDSHTLRTTRRTRGIWFLMRR